MQTPKMDPREQLRRLEAWRDRRHNTKDKDIADLLGISSTVFAQWKLTRGINEMDDEALDAAIEDARAVCEDERRYLTELLEANARHRYPSHAAKELGIDHKTFLRHLERAGKLGLDGSTKIEMPRGQVLRGVSTMSVKNPETDEWEERIQWDKTRADDNQVAEAFTAFHGELCRTLPRYEPIAPPDLGDEDLLVNLTLTDLHIGMLATPMEGGETWKLKEAERVAVGCFEMMVRQAPRAGRAVVGFLGDTADYDGLLAVTPTSGHVLDVDSRFNEMVRCTARVQRRVIDLALEHFHHVELLDAEANHDPASSAHRREMWRMVYEKEPRLTVLGAESDLPYYATEFGNVFLGYHHGHMKSGDDLRAIFTEEFIEMWARTRKRYIRIGHLHKRAKDAEGRGADILVEPTLAARNAFAARQGYRSMRRANATIYHREFGDVGQITVTPEMLPAAKGTTA